MGWITDRARQKYYDLMAGLAQATVRRHRSPDMRLHLVYVGYLIAGWCRDAEHPISTLGDIIALVTELDERTGQRDCVVWVLLAIVHALRGAEAASKKQLDLNTQKVWKVVDMCHRRSWRPI